ncbi:indole-3-glycerol phosphate synthase TrpC [Limnobacter humi]|uniref:Indole-3-glycerol phosphate synthase n=1 Tax=Limnobacter humi TaxID=1778671 RepID=A0ABT1WKU3_9BURK|nr:indole-3-glycerol phosphate synthase TrpC [Limnobacter humi]MCQ8897607.1 indole-3-glycerol phosphate synthase TrpC [Limnobacter humi]
MSDILDKILATKREEIALGKQILTEVQWLTKAARLEPARGFIKAMRAAVAAGKPAVIAEVKRASPSKGILREPFDPEAIAKSYAEHGATCLSVLTDIQYFKGAPQYLDMARQASGLPAIRKDFIIDTYQVVQARGLGADAILLIVSALDLPQLLELESCAHELGMDVLVEVHDDAEMDIALQMKTPLVGVNNRNLRTFEVSLDTTLALRHKVGEQHLLVTESGITTVDDVQRMRSHGVHAFLVGEAFMRASSPGEALAELFA